MGFIEKLLWFSPCLKTKILLLPSPSIQINPCLAMIFMLITKRGQHWIVERNIGLEYALPEQVLCMTFKQFWKLWLMYCKPCTRLLDLILLAVFVTQIISRWQKNTNAKVVPSISCRQKWDSRRQFSKKCIFPNIQLNVVNRLPPFKILYDQTNSFLKE